MGDVAKVGTEEFFEAGAFKEGDAECSKMKYSGEEKHDRYVVDARWNGVVFFFLFKQSCTY